MIQNSVKKMSDATFIKFVENISNKFVLLEYLECTFHAIQKQKQIKRIKNFKDSLKFGSFLAVSRAPNARTCKRSIEESRIDKKI